MSTDARAGTIAGDVSEWLCPRCNVIHPPPPGKPRITAPCPECGAAMFPTSPNLREIERLQGMVGRCRCDRAPVIGYQIDGRLYAPEDVTVWREAPG